MREVLFKGKMLHNNEWIEGGLVQRDGKAYIVGVSKKLMIDGIEVDPETVCQYTGFIDENKNKIWENDILFDGDIYSVVIWDEESAQFVIEDYCLKGAIMEYGYDEYAGEYGVVDTNGFDDFCRDVNEIFKVVGNIFDNQELLIST